MKSSRDEKLPSPPAHFVGRALRFWTDVIKEYELDIGDLERLRVACENLAVEEKANSILSKKGLTVNGTKGIKTRPEVGIARDSRIGFLRACRELGLGLDAGDGRPAQLRGWDTRRRRQHGA